MLTLKSAVALAISWSAALASVGALTLAMRTPVAPPLAAPDPPPPLSAQEAPALQLSLQTIEASASPVMWLQPVVVVSALHPRRVVARPPVAAPTELRCSEFRELEQGAVAQRVRVCE